MATLPTRPNPLKWTGGYYNREALWPKEPDIEIIKSLALKYLASELADNPNLNQIQVQAFAQGGFNKLFSISYPGHSTKYLFRVTLPIVPYYKVESEVAVLSYLKQKTSIPVARVIAWDSSVATDLGFEWVLLEKIEGIDLYDIWRNLAWEVKLKIVAALAPIIGQLRDHKFDRIGSLYFKGREHQPDPELLQSESFSTPHLSTDSFTITAESSHDEGSDQHSHKQKANEVAVVETADEVTHKHDTLPKLNIEALEITAVKDRHHSQLKNYAEREASSEHNRYIVGPLLDSLFYLYRRLYLPGNRGPYRTSREWMTAQIEFQRIWTNTGPSVKSSANREDFDEYDWQSDDEEEAPEIQKLCNEFAEIIPEVFPADEGESSYVLYHHDLNLANILVNPDTYEITGIIDWEKIQIVPEWKSDRFPEFLTYQMDFPPEIDDNEPRIPTAAELDEDAETHNPVVVERRDRWENAILRQHYDEVLSRTRGEAQFAGYESDSAIQRRDFDTGIMNITDSPEWARSWMEEYMKDKVGSTTVD